MRIRPLLYTNNSKNLEFDKKAPQNLCSERVTIAERQGTSEDKDFEAKPTQSKTNSSSCLCITTAAMVLLFLPSCKRESPNSCSAYGRDMCDVVADPDLVNKEKLILEAARLDMITEENIHCTLGTKNPPHYENVNYIVSGEYLYWRATEDTAPFARKFIEEPLESSEWTHKEYNNRLPWDQGFRLGLGYVFDCWDQWDLLLNYTWFSSEKTNREHTKVEDLSVILRSDFLVGIAPIFLSEAESKLNLNYNILDLELGRNYFVSKALTLRPFAGLRGAWINQHFDTDLNGIYAIDASATPPIITFELQGAASIKTENDFHGLGLRLGADLLWHFTNHFGLNGKISGSLLYGELELDERSKGNGLSEFTDTLIPVSFDKDYSYFRVQPNLELAAGLIWETETDCSNHISASIMYDFSEWFSFSRLFITDYNVISGPAGSGPVFRVPTTETIVGDLGLNGFSFKLRFDF